MALKILDLFKSIKWAKNGDVTDMSQTNYEAGWAHLGDDTPTVEDFNLVQKLNDEKDQWLFNQIESVCDAKNIPVTEDDAKALLKAINTSATLSQAGITQLSSAIDSTIETMAATPKAIKSLKDLIDALTLNLNNYIPNSKKSNVVDSNSADTVATSAAVKSANDNANGRVSKSGDTMTGHLVIKNGDYSGVHTFNNSGWSVRWESASQSSNHFAAIVQANNKENIVNNILVPKKSGTMALTSDIPLLSNSINSNSSDNVATSLAAKTAYDKGVEAKTAADNANNNANGRVSKSGGTMTGYLEIKNGDYSAVRTYNTAGWSVRWESASQSSNHFAAIVQANNKENIVNNILVPKKSGTMALISDIKDIVVLQGVINHGGTLPLPSGFNESQCKFIISTNNSNPNGEKWDWNETFKGKHYRNICELNGRVVTCQTIVNEGISGNGAIQTIINGKANYMVIGVK